MSSSSNLLPYSPSQLCTLPDVASIEVQTEIQWYMRPYLLDFLTEAHAAFGLLPETLFLCINILDRYCSKRIVYRRHYQLVGCTALLISAKYGECSKKVPHIRELASMCCGMYDEDMFTQMERHVMTTLEWSIGHPTIDSFIQIILDNGIYDPEVERMAQFISEISQFHKEFIGELPSNMSRAAIALARMVLGRPQASRYEWEAQYDPQLLVALSQQLHHPSAILSQKYKHRNLHMVALILENFLRQHTAVTRVDMSMLGNPTPEQSPVKGQSSAMDIKAQAGGQYCTPHAQRYGMVHGMYTPPITPGTDGAATFDVVKGRHPLQNQYQHGDVSPLGYVAASSD
jgi:hypothetical protein